ncbi:hypothetical protein [Flagellimonas onchidii]|uniref:hypothetical protein n=1 Tax=Flagellimonas onchidii TaxID=2562684 RepID=UPI0010A6816C|nr:hypothetical protein [Allomuricauda onchidii]
MKYNKFILIFFLGISILSCSKQERSIDIKDVTKQVIDTIHPKSNTITGYTNKVLVVKGSVNGKVKVLFDGSELILEGEIDKKFDMDYYGQIPVSFGFVPFEATKGELTITCDIF